MWLQLQVIVLSKLPDGVENGILFTNNISKVSQPVFCVHKNMLRFAAYGFVADKLLTFEDYNRLLFLSKYLNKDYIAISDLACIAPLTLFETFLAVSPYFSNSPSKMEKAYYVDPIFYNTSILSTVASELSSRRAFESIILDYADFLDEATLKVLNLLLQGLNVNIYLVFYNLNKALKLSTASRIDMYGGVLSVAALKRLRIERYLPPMLESVFNPGEVTINRRKGFLSIVSPIKEEKVQNFLSISQSSERIDLKSIFGQKSEKILELLRELHSAGGVALYQAFLEWARTLNLEVQDVLKLIFTEYISVERHSSSLYVKLSYKGFHII